MGIVCVKLNIMVREFRFDICYQLIGITEVTEVPLYSRQKGSQIRKSGNTQKTDGNERNDVAQKSTFFVS